MPKCRKCGATIKQKDAFAVKIGKRNTYYCSEAEYLSVQKEQQAYDNLNDKVFEIFGYYIRNSAYYANLRQVHQRYTWQEILNCVIEHEELFDRLMQKDFSTEYGQIRYFIVVLENKLSEAKPKEKEIIWHIEEDMPDMKYTKKERRKSLEDFEKEVW